MAQPLVESRVACPHCDAPYTGEAPSGGVLTCSRCGGHFRPSTQTGQSAPGALELPPPVISKLFEPTKAATLDDLLTEERKDLLAVVEALHRQEGQLADLCGQLKSIRSWLAIVAVIAAVGLGFVLVRN